MSPSRSRVHPLFLLAAVSGLLFCVTTLILLVLPWIEPATPFTRWLETNALPLIASEVVATLFAGVAGLCFDRPQPISASETHPTANSDLSGTDNHERVTEGGN